MFAAVMHLADGVSLDTVLTLKMEASLIFLVGHKETNSIHNTTGNFVLDNNNNNNKLCL
jgi:hypothetical protein